MKKMKKRKGFTIVELVIVIAVIAILATTLVPTFGNAIQNAKDSAAKQEAKNAFTSYMIEHPELSGSLFVYQTDGRYVAIQNGAPIGIYDTQAEACKALGLDEDAQFSNTGVSNLLISGDTPTTPTEPEDPNALYRIDPMTYYKEISRDNGATWTRTDIRENHTAVTRYDYPMENIQILDGSIRTDGWIYKEDSNDVHGALILIEDSIFDQVTITANNDVEKFAYAFLDDDLVNGVLAPFADNYKHQEVVTGQTGTKTFIIPDGAKYLYVYSSTGNTNCLPAAISFEKSNAAFQIDPITYYKEVSYDGGTTWTSTDIRADHSNVTEYEYSMDDIQIMAGSIRNKGSEENIVWKYIDGNNGVSDGYCGALILIEDTIFDQVTITANDTKGFVFTFLSDDLKDGTAPAFAQGYSTVFTGNIGTQTFDIPSDAKYLYVYNYSNDTIYLPASIKFSKSSIANETNSFTISTWNIGHFNSGSNMTTDAYRAFIQRQLGTDIICLNEYSTDYTGEAAIFQGYTAYEGPWRNYSCNAMYYKNLNMTAPEQKEFLCNEDQLVPAGNLRESDYYYVTTVVTVNGIEVTVVSVHLIFDKMNPNDDQINQDQIKELIEIFENTERVVLLGDWNCILFSYFDLFKEAGYSLANNDPTLKTFRGHAVNSNALDNIVYKGVIIEDFIMVETGLSDHNALKCTIVVE